MLEAPWIRRGEGPGPEPDTCEACDGTGRVPLEPWCSDCGAEGEGLRAPCYDSPSGHTVALAHDTCPDCDGTGNAPERDPDEDERHNDGLDEPDRRPERVAFLRTL